MYKLLKFEIKRKWKLIIYSVMGYLLVNFAFLYKFKTDTDFTVSELPFRIVFFIILGSSFAAGSFIGAVNNLRLEIKNPTRDLYFSLPVSSYAVIGSKILLSTVELIFAVIISTLVTLKSVETLTGIELLNTLMIQIKNAELSFLIPALIQSLTTVVTMILTIYLSFAIYRGYFSQGKFGGAITVIIYVCINYVLANYVFVSIRYSMANGKLEMGHYFSNNLVPVMINLTVAVLMYLITSILFAKRVSFD